MDTNGAHTHEPFVKIEMGNQHEINMFSFAV